MNLKKEIRPLFWVVALFVGVYFLPVDVPRFTNALFEALSLAKWYAREHVILCLVPAFFIAGAISVFVRQASVMTYLGAQANKVLAYGVASVSGAVLAVCSCTVLPLFAGIYRMGAGIGPATTFLYAGPAINVLAIILTARVLGLEMGVARASSAIGFSIVIGLIMQFVFRKEEAGKTGAQTVLPDTENARPLWWTVLYFTSMIGILVFANWAKPVYETGFWHFIYGLKWPMTGFFALLLGFMVITGMKKTESVDWLSSTWGFAKQILPLLLFGVLISGFALGRVGREGIIPSHWISAAVGGNSIQANLFASVVGALMYFATLTEVPILQGLMAAGMGKGPALALLLAGPALSLQNMLVLHSIMGLKKTSVYISLVIVMATVSGLIYGSF